MNDYIKREDATDAVWRILNGMGISQKHNDRLVEEVGAVLDEYTAADVRPVVRGKWIPDYDYAEYDYDGSTPLPEPRKFQDGWQCSLCGAYEPSTVNFCPNCGADMRPQPPKEET